MLRVRTGWSGLQGAPYLSTMFFDGTDLTAATNAVTATHAFWTAIKDRIHSSCAWTVSGEVEVIVPATGTLSAVYSVGDTHGVGADTNDLLPFTVQGLLRWNTGVITGGRRLRGRNFIPGPTEGYSTLGIPASSYISNIAAGAAGLIADAGSVLGVWSRKNGVFEPVTGYSVWNEWGSLLSRRN